MIDRFEILASKVRYLVSRNRWSARLLGYRPVEGHGDDPGLVLLQIDGLGEELLARALSEGKMPFLRHLLADEGHTRRTLYSGLTSNTPAFQAELFYGVKTAVPGFGFVDRETGREMTMNAFADSAEIEKRLSSRGEALLRGGSAWSDVFAGGARESHLCAATAGVGEALRALNPLRALAVVVWHGWSVVRVVSNFALELALAVYDFVRGTIAGRSLPAELRFIPERVAVTALMREIVTAGVAIDAERGLPVIHANFLGYDEHAHRRGPGSAFALWTLRGIDRSIRRIWLAAHRSPRRDYQVWIYSDHGQETVEPYRKRRGENVPEAVFRLWHGRAVTPHQRGSPDPGPRSGRSRWLRSDLDETEEAPLSRGAPVPREDPVVVCRGPVGFVYLPESATTRERDGLARRLADEALVPLVLARAGAEGEVLAWTPGRPRRRLADEAEMLRGHPHRERILEDLPRIVEHESAGDLVLMGWSPGGSTSFKIENGAHGGIGPLETSAFCVLPPETASRVPAAKTLRPLDLRDLARDVLDPGTAHISVRGRRRGTAGLRLMTYNVHGCRGMDGRFSTQRIARVIARAAPDVVCLQELDQSRARSGRVDQVHEIAAQLEKDFRFHAVAEVDDGLFGNAVLSSLPLSFRSSGPLPRLEGRLQLADRGVLWVEVDVDGITVQVLNTHLSIQERERRAQVEELLGEEWLGNSRCGAPLILAGDFNASADSHTARALERVLQNVVPRESGAPSRPTWSGRYPLRAIDHVFASADLEVRSVRVPRTRLSRVASDHLPLVVDLGLPGRG